MTYEEINTKYPIGKLLAREKISTKRTSGWATQADKQFFIQNYKQVVFHDDGYVDFVEEKIKEYRVEGWLCTAAGFFVAENTWDGWCPLDNDDIREIEAKGILDDICKF